jgi:hypothetical protein
MFRKGRFNYLLVGAGEAEAYGEAQYRETTPCTTVSTPTSPATRKRPPGAAHIPEERAYPVRHRLFEAGNGAACTAAKVQAHP